MVSEESPPVRACLSIQVQLPDPHEPLTIEVADVRWTTAMRLDFNFMHVHAEEQARLQWFIDWLKRTHNN